MLNKDSIKYAIRMIYPGEENYSYFEKWSHHSVTVTLNINQAYFFHTKQNAEEALQEMMFYIIFPSRPEIVSVQCDMF
ncbi:hypothetical protein ACB102_13165 [Aneurinibacillus sp. REN35]